MSKPKKITILICSSIAVLIISSVVYLKFMNDDSPGVKEISVNYIDESTGNILKKQEIITDVKEGENIVNAKEISGYRIYGNRSKTVTLYENYMQESVDFYYTNKEGKITIKYNDENGNDVYGIAPVKEVYSRLESYTIKAKNFPFLTLNDNDIKVVTLTPDNPEKTVEFKYTQHKGIYVEYVHEYNSNISYAKEDGNVIYREELNNVNLGDNIINAIELPGYTLVGASSVVVKLTDEHKNAKVTFSYKKN